jgi:hypothetical protein
LGKTRTDACGANVLPNDLQWIALRHTPFSGSRKIVDIEYAPS